MTRINMRYKVRSEHVKSVDSDQSPGWGGEWYGV